MTILRVGTPSFRHLRLGLLAAALLACGDGDNDGAPPINECAVAHDGTAAEILGFSSWEVLAESEDPWLAMRDATDGCSNPAPRVEEGTLEFDTKLCGSFSVRAPLLAGLRPGDVVTLVGSHSTLLSDVPAVGHLEVRVDDAPLFAYEARIPGPASIITLDATVTQCAPAGSNLLIHVRNHGANSWRINQIRRQAR